MFFLVDANVLYLYSKTSPEPADLQWLADHDAELHISTLSLGEMLKASTSWIKGSVAMKLSAGINASSAGPHVACWY